MDKDQILAEIQMFAAANPVKSEIVEETVEVLVADDDFKEAAVNSFQFDREKEVRKLFNLMPLILLISRMPKLSLLICVSPWLRHRSASQ